jgi:hypothetical protein
MDLVTAFIILGLDLDDSGGGFNQTASQQPKPYVIVLRPASLLAIHWTENKYPSPDGRYCHRT